MIAVAKKFDVAPFTRVRLSCSYVETAVGFLVFLILPSGGVFHPVCDLFQGGKHTAHLKYYCAKSGDT